MRTYPPGFMLHLRNVIVSMERLGIGVVTDGKAGAALYFCRILKECQANCSCTKIAISWTVDDTFLVTASALRVFHARHGNQNT